MKPPDIFKLAVRLLGLVFLYQGLQALPTAVIQFCGAIPTMNSLAIIMTLATAGWPLLVAYWLLRGAPLVMRTAYPESEVGSQSEAQSGGAAGEKARP